MRHVMEAFERPGTLQQYWRPYPIRQGLFPVHGRYTGAYNQFHYAARVDH